MGKVKQVLMSKEYDDFGPDEHPDWHPPQLQREPSKDPRDDMTREDWREIELAQWTDNELKAELQRRAKERQQNEKQPSNPK